MTQEHSHDPHNFHRPRRPPALDARDVPAVAATVAAGVDRRPRDAVAAARRTPPPAARPTVFELYVSPYVRTRRDVPHRRRRRRRGLAAAGRAVLAGDEEESFGEALAELVGPGIGRFVQLEEIFARHHPSEPPSTASSWPRCPRCQGHGIGSALLHDISSAPTRRPCPPTTRRPRPATAPVRAPRVRDAGRVTLPDGPPLWRMWRDPR